MGSELDQIRSCAKSLGLVDAKGELARLDSIMIVDFATKLEDEFRLEFPSKELSARAFASFESIAALIDRLREQQPG